MLVVVLFAPVLKPLEKGDIQFNKPLWTVGSGSIAQPDAMTATESKAEAPAAPPVTINLGEPDSTGRPTGAQMQQLDSLLRELPATLNQEVKFEEVKSKLDNMQQQVDELHQDAQSRNRR